MNSRASHRTLDGSTEIEAQDEHKLTLHKHIRGLHLPTSSLGLALQHLHILRHFSIAIEHFDNRYDTHAHIGDIGTLIYASPFQACV